MWCPDCKADFKSVAGSEVQVCPRCQAAAKKGKRKRRVPKLAASEHPARVKKNPKSAPKFRIDAAHQPAAVRVADQNSRGNRTDQEWIAVAGSWLKTKSMTHVVLFGLLLFLLGQAMQIGSFLIGHFVAWSIGSLVSIAGVVLATLAVAATLHKFDRRLNNLSKLVGKKNRPAKRPKTEPTSSRKSIRKSLRQS